MKKIYQKISKCRISNDKNLIKLTEKTTQIKDNIILKAAILLQQKTGTKKGATISLKKQIPSRSGLGGGSSDAAATLIVLNKLWKTNLNKKELLKLGLELGSDVPFFIHGQASWAEGRGEIFTDITQKTEWYLLIFPKTRISTEKAFNEVSISHNNGISLKEYLSGTSTNSFSEWSKEKYPEIRKIFSELENYGIPRLSGTGSTIFLSFSKTKEARKALKTFPNGILVKSLDHSPLRQLIE